MPPVLDRLLLIACAVAGLVGLILFIVAALVYPGAWAIVPLIAGALVIKLVVDARRSATRRRLRKATWEAVKREVYALPIEEARTRLSDIIGDPRALSDVPLPMPVLAGYPSSALDLLHRYATLSVDGLHIGFLLPKLHGWEAAEIFDIPRPHLLVGYDQGSDPDGEALVVREGEEAILTLPYPEEPDVPAEYVCPSIYHLVMARAELARQMGEPGIQVTYPEAQQQGPPVAKGDQ